MYHSQTPHNEVFLITRIRTAACVSKEQGDIYEMVQGPVLVILLNVGPLLLLHCNVEPKMKMLNNTNNNNKNFMITESKQLGK